MSKGKPRHDPNKKQNQYGFWCSAAEEFNDSLNCELYGRKAAAICKGNPHNCCKVLYHNEATKSDIRKINDRR